MAILPTKFIARVPEYPQDEEYGQYCADNAKELGALLLQHKQDGKQVDIGEINSFFVPKLQDFFVDRVNRKRKDGPIAAMPLGDPIRNHGTYTPLNAAGVKYMHYAREAILAHSEALGGIHSVNGGRVRVMLDDRVPPLVLTEISRFAPFENEGALERHVWHMRYPTSIGSMRIRHIISPDNPEYEPAKAAFNEALNEALGTQPLTHSASREEAALKSYYLYSHIMPFPRYSSSAARMLLEALTEVTELQTYHLAENRDINLEALVRNWSDFKQAHEKGAFWDKKASPADILKWQAHAIANEDGISASSSLKDYVHDALYIEAMGDKAEIFSNRRALLKELMDRTKSPASAEDKASDQRITPLLDEYTKLEDVKRYIVHPVTLRVGMVDYEDESGSRKQARGIQFGCSNWHDSDIQFGDLFLRKHMHESFSEKLGDKSFDDMQRQAQKPDTVLTEDGVFVKGTVRPFNADEIEKLRREFDAQKRQSKNGYVYGAPIGGVVAVEA